MYFRSSQKQLTPYTDTCQKCIKVRYVMFPNIDGSLDSKYFVNSMYLISCDLPASNTQFLRVKNSQLQDHGQRFIRNLAQLNKSKFYKSVAKH